MGSRQRSMHGDMSRLTHRPFHVKPSKSLQITPVSIICGGNSLKTPNMLAEPVGKKGVLGRVVNRW